MSATPAQPVMRVPRVQLSPPQNIVTFKKGASITVANQRKSAKVTLRINDIDTSGNSSVYTEASDYEVVIEPLNHKGHVVIIAMDDIRMAGGRYKFSFIAKNGSTQEWNITCGQSPPHPSGNHMYYAGGSLLAVFDDTSRDLDKSVVAKFRAYEQNGPKILGEDKF